MKTQTCTKCKVTKAITDFHFLKKKEGIRQKHCKACSREAGRIWRMNNKEKCNRASREYYYKQRGYDENNPPRLYKRKGVEGAYPRAKVAFARNKNLKNTFENLSKDQKRECEEIYDRCNKMNRLSGKYHVDHIAPISGVNISGLHVPWNLRIVDTEHNNAKYRNYMESDAWPRKVVEQFKEMQRWPKGR